MHVSLHVHRTVQVISCEVLWGKYVLTLAILRGTRILVTDVSSKVTDIAWRYFVLVKQHLNSKLSPFSLRILVYNGEMVLQLWVVAFVEVSGSVPSTWRLWISLLQFHTETIILKLTLKKRHYVYVSSSSFWFPQIPA